MTTVEPSHARLGTAARAWRTFRQWQRSRPFWGGLFIILAGVEMLASTRLTLNGLSFSSGATGLLALLIPGILVTCGVLLWLSPAQRLFYSIVAAITAVYSLIGLNLGGFFVGLLLGIVGSALAFAWVPTRPAGPAADEGDTQADDERDTTVDARDADADRHDAEQVGVDQLLTARPAATEPADGQAAGSDDGAPEWAGRSADPRAFGIVLLVLGLATAGLAVAPRAVHAAPGRPTASACPSKPATPKPATPKPGTSAPTGTPTPTPSASPTREGNIITDFFDGIGNLFRGGGGKSTTPSPTPTASGPAAPTSKPTTRPGSTDCPAPGKPGKEEPAKPGTVEPGRPLPRIAADPSLPKVGRQPSKLTGSKVTMTGLRFEGITDLQTEQGSLKVLKFSMKEAVTDDFLLVADGPRGRTQRYATDRLTVRDDVAFYCTRFVGRLAGIKLTLTPDLPFPDGLPVTLPIPVTFTDPVIDLAYVTSDTLTGRPTLRLTLGA
ncbi:MULTISPECIES: DUF6114 domain-containing protein [unclassified Micromonospora]|uniref:DUF6114 domain-containing protein n=1 Tax=unclassified Micromonospora TaxID=2617518 RepID=UPI001C24CA44|nr:MULTISPECIES: DUF6114 domain-containing protein [unclassified Micromonospora]MBU8857603.1 hypothetical protein [Micromonospora sp. WMMB482]MDM4783228.1 DUF6114 domain-containing protein [Micromonospora sp. b486]